ncbi:MAG: DUF99 family protein, partial [Thermoplasmata archaeon]
DATDRILRLVGSTASVGDLRALLLDGPLVGGFNVVDLDRLAQELGLPVVTVSRHRPDLRRIREVLHRYFPRDGPERWRLLRRHPPRPWGRGPGPLWGTVLGAGRREAARLLDRAAVDGRWPEPLRLAHMVARAGTSRPGRRTDAGSLGDPPPRDPGRPEALASVRPVRQPRGGIPLSLPQREP